MKKTGILVSLVMIFVMLMSQMAFAAGLEIIAVSPSDGETGLQINNMAVKLTFNQFVADEATANAAQSKITISDKAGNKVPYTVVYNAEKYPDQLWLIMDKDLESITEYTLSVKSGLGGAEGTLSEEFTSGFRTRDISIDNKISMALMMAMTAIMIVGTKATINSEKAKESEAAQTPLVNANPYKLAKEKNISVDQAKQIISDARAREEERLQKLKEKRLAEDAAMEAEIEAATRRLEEAEEAARHASNYQVKGPASVRAAGGRIPKSVIRKNKARRAKQAKASKNRKKK